MNMLNKLKAVVDHPGISGFFLIALFHAFIALSLKRWWGIDIESDSGKNTWEYFWQTLPMQDMQAGFWSSMWYLHAQPPLFNVYGFFLHEVFGPSFLQVLQYLNIAMGSAMCGMIYLIINQMTGRRIMALILALLLSLNPSIFLYEAFILYSCQVGFLVVFTVYLMVRFVQTANLGWYFGSLVVLNILILTRSLYHVLLIVPFIALGLICVHRKHYRRLLVISLLICAGSSGWYVKNYATFGFFGSSSWMGSNLWRIVSQNYTPDQLSALAEAGLLDRAAVDRKYFDRPSKFISYGFNKTSQVPVLSRDDYNNINMVDISRMHLDNSKRLIRHDPWHYLNNAWMAYGRFCMPSYETQFVRVNAGKMSTYIEMSTAIHGVGIMSKINHAFGTAFTSFYQFLIPGILLAYAACAIRFGRLSLKAYEEWIRRYAVDVLMILLMVFVTVIGSFFEYGENCRFKFGVESLIFCLLASLLCTRQNYKSEPR